MRAAPCLPLACALLAAPLHAQEPARTRIHGVELDRSPLSDRVLVFGEGPLRSRLEQTNPRTVMLIFPGATLDPSAARPLSPERLDGPVTGVMPFQTADGDEVRVTILHEPGISPTLSRRGGQVSLDFARPGRRRRAEPGAAPERVLDARWIDVDLRKAVIDLARFVGERLIVDDTLRGRVSIEASQPLTVDEARALIDTLLQLRDFAAVPAPGGFHKVVPLAGAPSPWVRELGEEPREAALTTLIHLKELDADLVFEALQPLVGEDAIAQVFLPTNSILLAGPGTRMRRLADVARALDDAGLRRLVLFPLRHADAATAADALLDLSEDGRWRGFEAWPDERTNRLVLRGRPDDIAEARSFLARLDRPAVGKGGIQVLPVQYADVEKMAEILSTLADATVQAEVPAEAAEAGGEVLVGRDFAVSVHRPTHSLVVRSDPETIAIAADLVAELDRPPDRVHVEVGVTELSLSGNLEIGFDALQPLIEPDDVNDWVAFAATDPSGSLESNLVGFSTGPDFSGFRGRVGRRPLTVPIGPPGPDGVIPTIQVPRESYVLTLRQGEARSRLLLRPHLVVLSGEEHEIFAGDNVPVPVAQTGGTASTLQTRQNIERRDTGVSLRVEPTVPEDGPIVLRLDLEVSDVSGAIEGGATFIERQVSARVRLAPGEEAFLASAALPTRNSVEAGVPFLRRIPILGWLFRATEDVEMATHILITVRAHRDRTEAGVLRRWMLDALDGRREVRAREGAG